MYMYYNIYPVSFHFIMWSSSSCIKTGNIKNIFPRIIFNSTSIKFIFAEPDERMMAVIIPRSFTTHINVLWCFFSLYIYIQIHTCIHIPCWLEPPRHLARVHKHKTRVKRTSGDQCAGMENHVWPLFENMPGICYFDIILTLLIIWTEALELPKPLKMCSLKSRIISIP